MPNYVPMYGNLSLMKLRENCALHFNAELVEHRLAFTELLSEIWRIPCPNFGDLGDAM